VAYTDWSIGDFIKRAREKSYFDDTVFVITADHCASSAGKTSVPVNRYHVPLWIYAPKHIPPQRVDRLMGQVDIAPTLLGLLNFSYRSRFFGYDLFQLEPGRERAFPATYEKLGYLHDDVLTVLEPQRKLEQMKPDYASGDATPIAPQNQEQIAQAVAYYQVASELFKRGQLARRPADATPVEPLPAEPAATPAPASSTAAPAAAGSAPAPAHGARFHARQHTGERCAQQQQRDDDADAIGEHVQRIGVARRVQPLRELDEDAERQTAQRGPAARTALAIDVAPPAHQAGEGGGVQQLVAVRDIQRDAGVRAQRHPQHPQHDRAAQRDPDAMPAQPSGRPNRLALSQSRSPWSAASSSAGSGSASRPRTSSIAWKRSPICSGSISRFACCASR
jgi:hypothetical protein